MMKGEESAAFLKDNEIEGHDNINSNSVSFDSYTAAATGNAQSAAQSQRQHSHHHHPHSSSHSRGHHRDCCDDDDGNNNVGLAAVAPPVPNPDDLDLFQAAQHGFTERVTQLLTSGQARALDLDAEGCTAMHWAAINNQVAVLNILLDSTDNSVIDVTGGALQSTPLHWAARAGQIHAATLLLSRGADPTRFDNQGYNSFHLAAHAGHVFMLLFLSSYSSSAYVSLVDAPDSMGRTALMWAAYQGNSLESIQLLIRLGASLDKVDSTGMTALHWATVSSHLTFAKILVDAGANPEIKDPQSKTAADWASERGFSVAYQEMIENSKRKPLNTPFSKVNISYFQIRRCFIDL
ncbi:Palmitoyltransferase Hip14 [Physocladia obscura]|uniref:protein S-acyltransferase n=1 Tax=Physocladia obscura TaxID=109957 RepID=A0AAD5SVQ8_9FUNG|nr:Palmitoyltransferase Hip14 [Physocladia obscura]